MREIASPRPSPKGEGEQLARFPGVFESAEHGVLGFLWSGFGVKK